MDGGDQWKTIQNGEPETPCRLSKPRDLDILVLTLHLHSRVNLKAERRGAVELGVRVFRGLLAVDPARERVALGLDAEVVPFAFRLKQGLCFLRLSRLGIARLADIPGAGHVHLQTAGNA